MTEPLDLDAVGQADLIARGEVSPVELVEAAIGRIEAGNGVLNAVIHERFDRARAEAAGPLPDGPFLGVPLLVKDALCAQAGEPHHLGMAVLKDHGVRAERDSWLTERFRAAGFVILGRTNLPELALRAATEPAAYGPTHNPVAPGHTTGGSSGGSAAAVADRWVAVAHANDMAGSIRIPASCCGLVGLKPTRARTSLGPDFSEYWGQMSHEHVLCRSVRDTAAVLDAVAGPAPGDPYTAPPPHRPWADEVGADPGPLRVGLSTSSPVAPAEPACIDAAHVLADRLAEAGHVLTDGYPAALDDPGMTAHYLTIMSVHVAAELERVGRLVGTELTDQDVEPTTWGYAEAGRSVGAVAYWEATEALRQWARWAAEWWEEHDLLVTPTMAVPPPELGHDRDLAMAAFTAGVNVSGQPAVSLPVHAADGLPIGAQLVGPYGREDLVIAAAAQAVET